MFSYIIIFDISYRFISKNLSIYICFSLIFLEQDLTLPQMQNIKKIAKETKISDMNEFMQVHEALLDRLVNGMAVSYRYDVFVGRGDHRTLIVSYIKNKKADDSFTCYLNVKFHLFFVCNKY